MHFSNFFRYFEACEQEFYHSLGASLSDLREKYAIMLPRVEAYCDYKTACRFDELIEVTVKVAEVAEKTITLHFEVYRKSDNKLAAEGWIKCISVDPNWRVVPLPVEIAKLLRESIV
jgi:YbgC/YbaW family acyl-CoA thioester hydrolase